MNSFDPSKSHSYRGGAPFFYDMGRAVESEDWMERFGNDLLPIIDPYLAEFEPVTNPVLSYVDGGEVSRAFRKAEMLKGATSTEGVVTKLLEGQGVRELATKSVYVVIESVHLERRDSSNAQTFYSVRANVTNVVAPKIEKDYLKKERADVQTVIMPDRVTAFGKALGIYLGNIVLPGSDSRVQTSDIPNLRIFEGRLMRLKRLGSLAAKQDPKKSPKASTI